jgi:hypothetical protein
MPGIGEAWSSIKEQCKGKVWRGYAIFGTGKATPH